MRCIILLRSSCINRRSTLYRLDNAEPVAYALRVIGYPIGSAIVAVGAICGITTVLLVLLYGQARISLHYLVMV